MSTYSIFLYGVLHISDNGYGGTHDEIEWWSLIKGSHLFYSDWYSQRIKVTIKNVTRIGKYSELWKITDDLLAFAKQKVK